MNFSQLNKDQKQQLKVDFYSSHVNGSPSFMEIMTIDDLVSDSQIEDCYGGVCFSPDDFWN